MSLVCPLCNTPYPVPARDVFQPIHQTTCHRCGANLVIAIGASTGTTSHLRCQRCSTAYVFPDDKLRQPLTKSTCRKCSIPFVFFTMSETVRATAASVRPMDAPPRVNGSQPVLSMTRRLSFYGASGSLFGIHIVNILLGLVTMGVYNFWGRVKVRRYLLSQSEFEGDRFAYHGTGKELFTGWLKALLIFGVPVICLEVVRDVLDVEGELKLLAALLIYGIGLLFMPIALVGARRYRLSRTSWRGIRFSFRGRAIDFLKLFVKDALLTALTLGFYYPFFDARRYAFLVSHSYFGNQAFSFDGDGRRLFGSYVLMLVLLPFTLGLSWFWFQAKRHRYLWGHTSFATARFQSTVTWGPLFFLKLGNFLLLVLTLSLGWPWVMVRNIKFTFKHVSLEGPLDVDAIQQEAQLASTTGEGLTSFFDFLEAGFDLG